MSCPFFECPLAAVQADRRWGREVRAALAEGRVQLWRQNIVTPNLSVRRFEVLARLELAGEVLSPAVWMPALETDGELAAEFDLWVLGEALRRSPGRGEQVWVNFCGGTVRRGFAGEVAALLRRYDVPPERLCVEVTEQVGMGGGYKREVRALVELGCDVAVDDCGAGYSNWGSVVRVPFTWLKVDGGLLASPRKLLVAKHLVLLGKELRLGVVAEWVETATQASLLLGWGCDGLQGFNVPRVGAGMPVRWD